MNDTQIVLKGESTYSYDKYGNETAETADKTVYGTLKSIGSREYLDARQLNLRPECVSEIYTVEYNGAKTVEIKGKVLAVYRTYIKGERLEMYLAERTGDNDERGVG